MINDYREDEQGELSIENMVTRVSRAVSPFLLPMIEELGSLELENLADNSETGKSLFVGEQLTAFSE